MKISSDLAAAALDAIKSELDGGTLYYFAGPVPADAGDALNMSGAHTQLVAMEGLTFDAAVGPVLPKAASEEWSGLVEFDGVISGPGTATPTFYRFCASGDNGRGASSGARLQGTIGGPSSSADIKLGDGTTVTDNGTNTRSLAIFNVDLSTLG